MTRILVCGGRDYADRAFLFESLDAVHSSTPIQTLIHGHATGADSLADEWARERRVAIHGFRALWKQHGTAAGPIRNQRMLDVGKPDRVIAFAGGRGTTDMCDRAILARIPVTRLP